MRNAKGKMIPLRSLVETRVVVGPQALIRYNNRLAVTVQGSPAPGVSSGQALDAMESVAARTLPRGLSAANGPTLLPGEARRGQDGDDPRLRGPVRLPFPRRAVRKLDHPGAGLAVGHGRSARRLRRHRKCPA